LRDFSPKETAWLVQLAGVFEASRMGTVLEQIMELDFAHLLRDKGEPEGGRLQIKTSRVRRASRAEVEGLVEAGLSKIRRKQLFEDDPDAPDWLLFRTRTPADLRARLEFLQIEPNWPGPWWACGRTPPTRSTCMSASTWRPWTR
jgi:hypothetical protein